MSDFYDDETFDPYGDSKGLEPTPTEMVNFLTWLDSAYTDLPDFRTLDDEELLVYLNQYARQQGQRLQPQQWLRALRNRR
jgi:hypothetical protein